MKTQNKANKYTSIILLFLGVVTTVSAFNVSFNIKNNPIVNTVTKVGKVIDREVTQPVLEVTGVKHGVDSVVQDINSMGDDIKGFAKRNIDHIQSLPNKLSRYSTSDLKNDSFNVLTSVIGGGLGQVIHTLNAMYDDTTNLMQGKLPVKLKGHQKEMLRPYFGSLVDRIRVTYKATIPRNASAQAFRYELYLEDPYRGPDDPLYYDQLIQLAHEMTHSLQYEQLSFADGFGSLLGKIDVDYYWYPGFSYHYGRDALEGCLMMNSVNPSACYQGIDLENQARWGEYSFTKSLLLARRPELIEQDADKYLKDGKGWRIFDDNFIHKPACTDTEVSGGYDVCLEKYPYDHKVIIEAKSEYLPPSFNELLVYVDEKKSGLKKVSQERAVIPDNLNYKEAVSSNVTTEKVFEIPAEFIYRGEKFDKEKVEQTWFQGLDAAEDDGKAFCNSNYGSGLGIKPGIIKVGENHLVEVTDAAKGTITTYINGTLIRTIGFSDWSGSMLGLCADKSGDVLGKGDNLLIFVLSNKAMQQALPEKEVSILYTKRMKEIAEVKSTNMDVEYQAFQNGIGLGVKRSGQVSGDEANSINGLTVDLKGSNECQARYSFYHHWNGGWGPWFNDGDIASSKLNQTFQAIQMYPQNCKGYVLQYRVKLAQSGWSEWVSNGLIAGKTQQPENVIAIEIIFRARTLEDLVDPANGDVSDNALPETYRSHPNFSAGTITSGSNIPPIANAGVDLTVNENEVVRLDGSGSYDRDGVIVSYKWGTAWGPGQGLGLSYSDLSGVNTAKLTFTAPRFPSIDSGKQEFTSLRFVLTVTDDKGATATDTVNVVVKRVNSQ